MSKKSAEETNNKEDGIEDETEQTATQIVQQVKRNIKTIPAPQLTTNEIEQAAAAAKNAPILLPKPRSEDQNKICLVLDLDETLVHSAFQPMPKPDMIVPVVINGVQHKVYVLKRPHVDTFLQAVGKIFECVLFTASLSIYADRVCDQLDPQGEIFKARLFRQHCIVLRQTHVKDLSRLGRPMSRVAIIDNSPAAYMLQPDNAIPVGSWFDDPNDTELLDMIPFLKKFAKIEDVYKVLKRSNLTQK